MRINICRKSCKLQWTFLFLIRGCNCILNWCGNAFSLVLRWLLVNPWKNFEVKSAAQSLTCYQSNWKWWTPPVPLCGKEAWEGGVKKWTSRWERERERNTHTRVCPSAHSLKPGESLREKWEALVWRLGRTELEGWQSSAERPASSQHATEEAQLHLRSLWRVSVWFSVTFLCLSVFAHVWLLRGSWCGQLFAPSLLIAVCAYVCVCVARSVHVCRQYLQVPLALFTIELSQSVICIQESFFSLMNPGGGWQNQLFCDISIPEPPWQASEHLLKKD